MTHELPNVFSIISGPSQWDLMLGLFEPTLMNQGTDRGDLFFKLESEDGRKFDAKTYIDGIKRVLAPSSEIGSHDPVTVWVVTGDFSSFKEEGFSEDYFEKKFVAEYITSSKTGLFRF